MRKWQNELPSDRAKVALDTLLEELRGVPPDEHEPITEESEGQATNENDGSTLREGTTLVVIVCEEQTTEPKKPSLRRHAVELGLRGSIVWLVQFLLDKLL